MIMVVDQIFVKPGHLPTVLLIALACRYSKALHCEWHMCMTETLN